MSEPSDWKNREAWTTGCAARSAARDLLVADGITINGLPIMTKARIGGTLALPDLDIYYEDCVIGGPSAFIVPVTETQLFGAAIRRKLILEIAGRAVPPAPLVVPAQFERPAPRVDCLLGERLGRMNRRPRRVARRWPRAAASARLGRARPGLTARSNGASRD